jgi:ABC-2 type transport system permease protein
MIFTLYVASLKEYLRDRLTLFWTLAFPILFILLFGLIFSGGGSSIYNVALVNLDSGQAGQTIMQTFQSSQIKKIFAVKTGSTVDQENSFQDQLKNGQLDMVIVLPPNLSANAGAGTATNVQLYYDGSKEPQGQIMLGVVQNVLTAINQQFTNQQPLITPDVRSVTTSTLNAIDFLVPGILAMSLMQLGLFGTTLPLVSLRERKILRRLGATPLPRSAVLVSQVLLRLTISLFQTALILGIGYFVFHVAIANPLATAGIVVLGALMFISLGYFLASVARTQESANAITQAINFPMLFLSGVFFSISALPVFLAPIIKILPLSYLADAMRQMMINSTPDFPLTVDIAVLAGWTIVCALLSVRLFKWE